MKKLKDLFLSVSIALVLAIILGCITIVVLLAIAPKNEQGQAPMPIMEFFMGWLVGIIAFFVVFKIALKKLRQQAYSLTIGNKPLLWLYVVVSLLFVFGIVLSLYGYSFSGYYSDKIISWLWLAFTLVIIARFWKNKIANVYLISLITLVFLSILPMLIPFFGIVYYFSTIGDYQQITIDKTYRLERTQPNVLSRKIIIIYKKQGLLEKVIATSECYHCKDLYEDIYAIGQSLDPRENHINDAQLVKITNDSITIEPTVNNKEIRVTYPLLKN